MNKLETIHSAVNEHFAAKEAWINRKPDHTYATTEHGYNPSKDAVMTMLRDLLPFLEIAVAIEMNDGKLPELIWYSMIQRYETEVAKLLEEIES